ncbi:PhnA protein [Ensifer adhaerens]|uniref:PhnA domain-containing protein n=1 Tax=Ensifer canadensis TaxID=555315 RepID=UPI00148FABC0|nr:alkylphosphonate utilization protein [Ensifer canadensis]NOV20900.1 PhnA protein [Ensifer canadensis]
MNVKDSNGTPLSDGDSVTRIKDLKVKSTSITLTGNEEEIECRAEKVKNLVLRTEFLKKA